MSTAASNYSRPGEGQGSGERSEASGWLSDTPEPLVASASRPLTTSSIRGEDLRLVEPSAGDGAFIRGIGGDGIWSSASAKLTAYRALRHRDRKMPQGAGGNRSSTERSSRQRRALGGGSGRPLRRRGRQSAIPPLPVHLRRRQEGGYRSSELARDFLRVGLKLWLAVFVARSVPPQTRRSVQLRRPDRAVDRPRRIPPAALGRGELPGAPSRLFERGSFPGVLQEVAVFSGQRAAVPQFHDSHASTVGEHDRDGASRTWTHCIDPEQRNWTRYLLEPIPARARSTARWPTRPRARSASGPLPGQHRHRRKRVLLGLG